MDLRSLFADARFAGRVDQLIALARPCVRLHTAPGDDALIPVGASKVGGTPDVPDSFEWPGWNGEPLAFLAQIDLADVAGFEATNVLPRSGLLSFFYDAQQRTWGFDPQDRGSWRVFHFPSTMQLARRSFPPTLLDRARYDVLRVSFREAISIAPYGSPDIRQLGLSEAEADAYWQVVERLAENHEGQPLHQLVGHAVPIQGDMHLECQLASNGVYCGDLAGYRNPRRAELEPGAVPWRLLLQLDSEEDAVMMWGDLGRLYFWVREEDLVRQNFDDAWMILQCG